ncbi:hypothetical protein D3C72_2044110 [compost metagenome]
MQAVDHIRQLALVTQLCLVERPIDHYGADCVLQCHPAFTVNARRGQRHLVRAQSLTEQETDTFHPITTQ